METIINVLISTGIGLMGIFFYTLWSAKRFFIQANQQFSLKTMIRENIGAWTWSLLVILITAILTIAIPETAEGISTFTGLELITNKAGFFTFGLGLSALIKKK